MPNTECPHQRPIKVYATYISLYPGDGGVGITGKEQGKRSCEEREGSIEQHTTPYTTIPCNP